MSRISVLGAGSWGTALSLLLARKGFQVKLWVWDHSQAAEMEKAGSNPKFLPGFPFPSNLTFTTSMPEAVEGAEAVVFVVVSEGVIGAAKLLKECLPRGIPIISGTKGLDSNTGLTVSQTLGRILPEHANPIVALSGPNLALEVAKGIPTATVAACPDQSAARYAQNLFMCPTLRVYTNTDIIGVELAGALKNVIAIGAGVCDGLGFGDNTKAALLTRGLAEITRLGIRLGAQQATFMGLAGVGDLMATCASPLSRNRRVGLGLAMGRKLADILEEIGQVAEGVPTTNAAYNLARANGVQMPIVEEVYAMLFLGKSPQTAVAELMSREPKNEMWA